MTDAFQIKWTNPESENYVDILDTQLFAQEVVGREITHPIQRPRGSIFWGKCDLQVKDNSATLTYLDDDRWWPGTTKIVFADWNGETLRRDH